MAKSIIRVGHYNGRIVCIEDRFCSTELFSSATDLRRPATFHILFHRSITGGGRDLLITMFAIEWEER